MFDIQRTVYGLKKKHRWNQEWLTHSFFEKKSCFPSVPKDSKLFEVGTKEDTKETHKERPSGLASASHQVGFEENYKRKLCA